MTGALKAHNGERGLEGTAEVQQAGCREMLASATHKLSPVDYHSGKVPGVIAANAGRSFCDPLVGGSFAGTEQNQQGPLLK